MAESLLVRKGGGGAEITGSEETFVANETINVGDLVCYGDVLETAQIISNVMLGTVDAGTIRHTRKVKLENDENEFLSYIHLSTTGRAYHYRVNDDFTITILGDSGSLSFPTTHNQYFSASDAGFNGILAWVTSNTASGIGYHAIRANPRRSTGVAVLLNQNLFTGTAQNIEFSPLRNYQEYSSSAGIMCSSTNQRYVKISNRINSFDTTINTFDNTGDFLVLMSDAVYAGIMQDDFFITSANVLQAFGKGNGTSRAVYRHAAGMARTSLFNMTNLGYTLKSAFGSVLNKNSNNNVEGSERHILFATREVSGGTITDAIVFNNTAHIGTTIINNQTISTRDATFVDNLGNNFLVFFKNHFTGNLVLKNFSFNSSNNVVSLIKEIDLGVFFNGGSGYSQIHKLKQENHYLIADNTTVGSNQPNIKILKITPRIKKAVTAEEKQKIIGVAIENATAGNSLKVIIP
jgi:hypothetical protein